MKCILCVKLMMVKRNNINFDWKLNEKRKKYKGEISGITPWIKVQDTIYIRGVAKSAKFKFQISKM